MARPYFDETQVWISPNPSDERAVRVVNDASADAVQMWRKLGFEIEFFSSDGKYWMPKDPRAPLIKNTWYRIKPGDTNDLTPRSGF